MSSVTTQCKEGDPETLVIVATAVALSPVKRPTFRVRNSKTKDYVAPGGYQTGIHEFSWDVVRDGETLRFSGPLEAFKHVGAEDSLSLEVPAVGYSASFHLPPKPKAAESNVPQPSVDIRKAQVLQLEPRTSQIKADGSSIDEELAVGIESESTARSEPEDEHSVPSVRRPKVWLIALALSTAGSLAFGGWQTFELSTLKVELASVQARRENAAAALETLNSSLSDASLDRDKANVALTAASSEKQRLADSIAALELERNAARRKVEVLTEDLEREQKAHQSTRDRLAEVQKQLDAGVASGSQQLRGSIAALELERNVARRRAESASADLEREERAHQTTREQLADLQKKFDAERAPPRTSPSVTAPSSAPYGQAQGPLAGATSPAQSPFANRTVTDCDRYAANPNDRQRLSNDLGVKWPDLKRNATAALVACTQAMDAYPNDWRILYQMGRAADAAGMEEKVKPLFEKLAEGGYAAAYDNAGQYYARRGRWSEAEPFFRKGVAFEDVDSMVSLADAIRGQKIIAKKFGEAEELYDRAAALGHKGAQVDVEQRRSGAAIIRDVGGAILQNLPRR